MRRGRRSLLCPVCAGAALYVLCQGEGGNIPQSWLFTIYLMRGGTHDPSYEELGASDVSGNHYKLRDTCLTPSIGQLSRDPDTSVTRTRGLKTKTHNFFINLRTFLSDDADAICQS